MICRADNDPDGVDDFWHCGCHITERAREHAHIVSRLVHLDTRAVELQLEGRLTECHQGFSHALGGGCKHRLNRTE